MNENPRNFFAVQWIMDPHATYNPPDRFPTERTKNRASLPRPLEDYRKLGSKGDPKTGLPSLPEIADVLTETERAYLRELYDRELESVDERVGYILKGLETSGLAESTLIVFTSDHGEGFGEHGRFLHGGGRWLYQEFIRIPLIVSGPGVLRGRRVAGPVSLVDLMPTLCELLRVRCLEDAQGESFRTVLTGEAQALPDSRGAYIVGTTRRGQFDALIRGDFKLILTPDGRELYDLEADPDERRDLSTERPEIVARLTTEILALRVETEARRTRGGEDPEVLARASEETLEQLRALGYVESPN